MPTTARAPGKIILFGEHAVVYGEPAIAVPVKQVTATAVVTDAPHQGIHLRAPDFGVELSLVDAPADHPLAAAVRVLLTALEPPPDPLPGLTITVRSTIPIAAGLGSGAAIAAALIRALARHLGRSDLAQDAAVSQLTFEVEKIHHGTPSGIDNTVVSYARPVYFIRAGAPLKYRAEPLLETFAVGRPLRFLIGDTGVKVPTREPVGDVRRLWETEPATMETLFNACGRLAAAARPALEAGDIPILGRLMNENQALLERLTVSSDRLERLIAAARTAGATGAKLSGGGRGGNMIALVTPASEDAVRDALLAAGAVRVLATSLP